MAIDIQPHAAGSLLAVRALPGSRVSGLRGQRAGALVAAVAQVAERGKANAAIVELLASELKLKRGQIELLRGQTAATKRFLIRGLSPSELAARIDAALARSKDD